MSHPRYSEQALALLSPAALKVIAKAIGIKEPAFRKTAVISQILEFQAKAIASATPAPNTCKNCPLFKPHNDGTDRGWCELNNRSARECHQETQDCRNRIEGELASQEWDAAQSEVLEVLEEQVRSIAPEEIATIEHDGHTTTYLNTGAVILSTPGSNVYMIPSATQAGVRYRVDLFRRTCTCTAGSYSRSCRHIKEAERQSKEDFEYWQQAAAKLPDGWREKQVVHTTPAGKETQTWFYNSKGHRTNVMPV